MSGNAIIRAAEKLKPRMLEVAGRVLGCQPTELAAADGAFFVQADPTRRATFDQVAQECHKQRLSLCGQPSGDDTDDTPGQDSHGCDPYLSDRRKTPCAFRKFRPPASA